MSRPNLGYLFYRECYVRGEDPTHISRTIDSILQANAEDTPVEAPHRFELTTAYPGLLIGSGYPHGLAVESDAKIGFYFDHSSGLPVIPGSSVKGVLRSLFGLPMKGKKDPHADAKAKMIRALLQKPDLDVQALARSIFEGLDEKGKPLGLYRRDRFYEARVVATRESLMADDYLTPHKNLFENPIPIRFLKVAPGVTFRFAFSLSDTTIADHLVTAEEKEKLFFQLIAEFGIGAKTNVGYGNFEPIDMDRYEQTKKKMRQKARNDVLWAKVQETDSPAVRIATIIEIVKKAETLRSKLKEIEGELSEEEKSDLIQKIEEKFGAGDKFAKKAINRIKSM